MKLLMENWRKYVAEVEQEEEPLEEGWGSKILAGLALIAGTAAGSGQAHAGDGVVNISPEKTQMLVQAYDVAAASTSDQDPKKNKILRAKADLVKSAEDGQITRAEVETWGPASQSIMMQVMQTLNEPSAPEAPTTSSASDAPAQSSTAAAPAGGAAPAPPANPAAAKALLPTINQALVDAGGDAFKEMDVKLAFGLAGVKGIQGGLELSFQPSTGAGFSITVPTTDIPALASSKRSRAR